MIALMQLWREHMKSKKSINWKKLLVIALVIIGAICVLDNTIRLGSELVHAVTSTIGHHQWSTVVIH
jgi:hypothetical protein